MLKGDLDNVVAKALRKEPARRYPGAWALAEDLRRHAEGLPVRARKDTLAYRAGKFVQRHKVGLAAEGEPLLRQALADGVQVDRGDFAHTIGNLDAALGECLSAQKCYAEAEPLLLTGHEDLQKRPGPQTRLTIQTTRRLHDLYLGWNKPAEAARYADDATAEPPPAP